MKAGRALEGRPTKAKQGVSRTAPISLQRTKRVLVPATTWTAGRDNTNLSPNTDRPGSGGATRTGFRCRFDEHRTCTPRYDGRQENRRPAVRQQHCWSSRTESALSRDLGL